MKKGIFYGTGVGPGDPELITLKAVRLIRESQVVAFPGKDAEHSVAFQIASQAVPELSEKELLPLSMPMTTDPKQLSESHAAGADRIRFYLDRGENVVYLTLGDPAIYCTFSYLQKILLEEGYPVEMISGVPSFCAAAARLNHPLVLSEEPLHILPAEPKTGWKPDSAGAYVLMKKAVQSASLNQVLSDSGRIASAVTNCGMEGEQVFSSVDPLPEKPGYFTLLISRFEQKGI